MPEPFLVPRVKVCGLTTAGDVTAAVAAGVDALGFVHYESSPRSLELEQAARLTALVPDDVLTIAVLVDARPLEALAWATGAGARAVQLCGAERAGDWAGYPLPLLRRIAVTEDAQAQIEAWRGVACAFVLDHPGGPGGTGLAVEGELAARIARLAPCLLAGGLDENNVRARIMAVRPAGVDASSRLESAPGRKDPLRVQAFVRAAHEALGEFVA